MFRVSNVFFQRYLLFVVVFFTLFPTIRLLTLGSEQSSGLAEYLFSALPDISAVFLLVLMVNRVKNNNRKVVLKSLDKVFLFFLISNLVVGSIVSRDLIPVIYGIRLTYFPMLFYFILRWEREMIPGVTEKIFNWFTLVGIIGIILYFFFYPFMIYMITLTDGTIKEYFIVRMTSVFWTPVVFSTFMSGVFIFFYWKYLVKGEIYSLIPISIAVLCVSFSVSRGSLGVVFFGFIILSFLCFSWKRVLAGAGIVLAVFISSSVYISGSSSGYADWAMRSAMETIQMKEGVSRVELWKKSFSNFSEKPFGYGIGKTGHTAARFFSEDTEGVDYYSTDSWFLKLVNETGIWGLVTYFFYAGLLFLAYIKRRFFRYPELVLFFTVFACYNLQNLVSNVLDFYLFSILYWMMAGASVNLLYQNDEA